MDALIDTRWIGALAARTPRMAAADAFVMAGIEWSSPVDARIELRARPHGGRWTPWTLVSAQGHDSDNATSPAHACFGEPVWTGAATELQLRANRPVDGLSVHLVSARIMAQSAPPRARPALAVRSGGISARGPATAASGPGSVDGLPLAAPVLPAGPGQPPIIARAAWAGHRGPAAPPQYGDVRMMFVHHSVNANGYSAEQVPGILLSIYEFHRYVRGWNDIGYNFAIDAFGRIWEAREGGIDQAVVGAQAGGYNLESTGVVMLGTFTAVLPTPAALDALTRLLAWKLSLHGVPVSGGVTLEVDPTDAFYTPFAPGQHVGLTRISGHRQGCTTDCPGDALFGYLPVIRADVHRLVGPTQRQLSLELVAGQPVRPATYLDLAEDRLVAGETVNVQGRLSEQSFAGAAGPGVAGVAVELQSLEGQSEAVVASAGGPFDVAMTDSDGGFSAALTPTHNLLVRALAPGAPAVASALVAVAVAPALTLVRETDAGPLVLRGTVSPPKATLELEAYRTAGARAPAHRERIDVPPGGSFEVRPQLRPGTHWLRVVSAADAANVAGASRPLEVSVA